MSKLIAESVDSFINEAKPHGFQRGVDPRVAMGTGYVTEINNWLKKEGNRWGDSNISIPDNIDTALRMLFHFNNRDIDSNVKQQITNYIKFIITGYKKFDKNEALDRAISYGDIDIMDILINQGAKFLSLPNKLKYIYRGGLLIELTPEEELKVAVNVVDFDKFKNLIENGVKLTMGVFNAIFSPKPFEYQKDPIYGYNNQDGWREESERQQVEQNKMKEFLKKTNLEKIVHPKDLKKIDKIKGLLGTAESIDRQYPHGYKIYRALKWVDKTHPTSVKEILKFIYNLGHGANSYNTILHGSHWMDGYKALIRPVVDIAPDGEHTLNGLGVAKLAKLEKKFGTMKIDPPPYI